MVCSLALATSLRALYQASVLGFDVGTQVSSRAYGMKDTLCDVLIVSSYCPATLKAMRTRVDADSAGALISMRDVLMPP